MSNDLLPSDTRPKAELRPRGTSFAGLVGVELRRLWWRRLTKAVLVAVVVFIGVATYASFQETRPEAIAQRIDDYNRMVAETKVQNDAIPEADKAAQLAQCRADQAEAQRSGASSDFGCDQMFQPPPPSAFGIVGTARGELTRNLAQGGVYLFGFLAFLLGASFIAAEFASGAMGNWLTFQPRRLRVGSTKLIAAAVGGLGVGALGVGAAALGALLVTTVNRPGQDLQLPDAPVTAGESVGQTLLRVVAIVMLGGLGGAVVGLVVRSTAGVVGVVVGWAIVAEGFIAGAFAQGRLQPWFLRTNIEAFVQNGATYFVTVCSENGCQGTAEVTSFTHAWVYLLVLGVVGVAVALVTFRRRDVA